MVKFLLRTQYKMVQAVTKQEVLITAPLFHPAGICVYFATHEHRANTVRKFIS